MKIGPFELVRAAKAPATQVSQTPVREQGASGTLNLSGFLQDDEYNSDLIGKRGLDAFRRMIDSDGATREAWLHIKAPLLNADWDVDPASDDPIHLEQAELVRRCLFDFPAQSLRQVMPTMLKYLTQGFQLYELPEMLVDADLTWRDPNTDELVTAPGRQFVVWEHFAHRKPETIWRWFATGGRLDYVIQLAWKDGDYGQWEIPAEQILLFVNDREGDDFTGQSILRAAYKAWYLKELVEKINAIAVERHGVGINVCYVPNSARNDTALIDRLEQMLQDLAAGERPYLIIPGPKGMATGTDAEGGFYFEVVTPGSAAADNTTFMTYLRGEIKGSMLVRFSELGHGVTGARAVGDVQAKVWYDVLHAVAFHIGDTFRPSIRRLLEKNYPQVDKLPALVARNIDARSMAEFADAVSKLSLANMILPDRSARQVARQTVGMPDEDEDAVAQTAELDQLALPKTEPLDNNSGSDPGEPDPQTAMLLLETTLRETLTGHAAELDTRLAALGADRDADADALAATLAGQNATLQAAIAAIPEMAKAMVEAMPAPTFTLAEGAVQVAVPAAKSPQLNLTLETPTGKQRHELTFDADGKVTGSVVTPIEED